MRRPSRYTPPQRCSPDRLRGRAMTIRQRRSMYELAEWDPPSEPMWAGTGQWLTHVLPRKLAKLPEAEAFSLRKWGVFVVQQGATILNQVLANSLHPLSRMEAYRDYASLFESIRPPAHAAAHWQSDADFAEQRLNGCNPMVLTRCEAPPHDALCRAAEGQLAAIGPGWNIQRAVDQGRLFAVDYTAIETVRDLIPADIAYSAPTALFFAREDGRLWPLAIRLFPLSHPGPNVPVTPETGAAAWALAKLHFQVADGAYHEAISHLLETHLVTELIASCLHRNVHPDHPVSQLLTPHFVDNLAIDALARTSLLNKGGPIDSAIGVGARGALRLVGLVWSSWDFQRSSLERDLARRGLDDRDRLPGCWYREDATALKGATSQLFTQLTRAWYADDQAVQTDWELQGWADETARADGGALSGFPARFETREALAQTLTEIVFRASAQHAAVNNGQYDRYGWPPYSPTSLRITPASDAIAAGRSITDQELWGTMPTRAKSLAQLSMARVLSAATYTSLVRTGDSPAFQPEVDPLAAEAIQAYRQRLSAASETIRRRNAVLVSHGNTPYTYLDPYNISRSIEI